jgi:hypothetical protein
MTKHQAAQRISTAWQHRGLRSAVRVVQGAVRLRVRVAEGPRDRGDVPGWVLVTIMTAGLVVALWAIAGPKLGQLFGDAVDSVHGP